MPWWLNAKESACNVGGPGSVPGLGRFPGEGNGYPLQYSYLENPIDRGAWWAISMGSQRVVTTNRGFCVIVTVHFSTPRV